VNFFNRQSWIPLLKLAEDGIRLASKITKLLKAVMRGDWKAIRKRISMIGKMDKRMTSSRPPAF